MRALGPARAMMLAVWMASGVTAIPKRSGHQVSKKLELFFFFCLRGALRDEEVRRFSRAMLVATGMDRGYAVKSVQGAKNWVEARPGTETVSGFDPLFRIRRDCV